MKRLFIIIFVLAFIAPSGFTKSPAPKVWSGYLMDKMCSKRMVGHPEKMASHSKTCLTEESCSETGYGLMTEKKFIPFDAKGNEMASKYIAGSSKDKDFQITVTGSMKKNKLAITDLKDKQ